jgi:hypothetical protein
MLADANPDIPVIVKPKQNLQASSSVVRYGASQLVCMLAGHVEEKPLTRSAEFSCPPE